MRRQDIQLLSAARQGDVAAKREIGRRYLLGSDGFPRHVPTGIEYLTHPSIAGLPEVAKIIAECLPLQELLKLQQEESLHLAAASGSLDAQLKLGVWQIISRSNPADGIGLLEVASQAGHRRAADALSALQEQSPDHGLGEFLLAASHGAELDGAEVCMLAAREALKRRDFPAITRCLSLSFQLAPVPTDEVADLVIGFVRLAEESGHELKGLSPASVQGCLEIRCNHGDYRAAYMLGRALCGIDCGGVAFTSLVDGTNFRRGAALLLRAADDGCDEAWLYLYRLHADILTSLTNTHMARFFLEKAAKAGKTEAMRKLGASILREARSLREWEQGIDWLFRAFREGDALAERLLRSLVFPLEGSDTDAKFAIDEVARKAPWLAVRLQLSRDFGLTKLEALTVSPADGAREWGLVIGQNPFITQARLSAPRTVPAMSDGALARLRAAADFFAQVRRDGSIVEGDLRHRSQTQRTAFQRHHLDEGMFFADVTSSKLDTVRHGPKWAVRVKKLLATALA
ncbi:MAG: hypothetical protein HYX43_14210 [Burkholderiales bacterium]|nr:hypothetical protein [Burkholderiales bacterium]